MTDEDGEPLCDVSGTCTAPYGARSITNCIHCGKQLERRADGFWYTWDADKHPNPRPQWQEVGPDEND